MDASRLVKMAELAKLDGNRKTRRINHKRSLKLIEELTADRPCGDCTACCTKLSIVELTKPEGVGCRHETPTGCGRYASRPGSCRSFYCLWKVGVGRENERPDKSGFVMLMALEDGLKFVLAMADKKSQITQHLEQLQALALAFKLPVICRVPQDPEYFAFGTPEQQEAVRLHQQRKTERRLKGSAK